MKKFTKKNILVLIIIFHFVSCKSNLSQHDTAEIKSQIALHNATVGLQMKINRASIDSTHGYFPNLDSDLTYDKFMNWCKENDRDPLRESEALTTNKVR